MDKHSRLFVQGLFTKTTVLLQRAADAAIKGQAPRLSRQECRKLARELRIAAADLAALADTAAMMARNPHP